MSDYTVTDLIKYSIEQKPVDFEAAFNDLIADKIQSAVDARKVEIAQGMFVKNEFEETDSEE